MRLALQILIVPLLFFNSLPAAAFYLELGINYAYKKTSIDQINNSEQQSTTGSVSLYFWDRVALELSYTNSLYIKKEQNFSSPTLSIRTTSQVADIYGSDLIYVFADKKAAFQPYIKAGVAYVTKNQRSQDDNNVPRQVANSGTTPSYGIGLKYFLTDSIALRTGFDVVQTPVAGGTPIEDSNGRFGLSWIF